MTTEELKQFADLSDQVIRLKAKIIKIRSELLASSLFEENEADESQSSFLGAVSGSLPNGKRVLAALIDRIKYELRIYTELAKRMDELMHECNLEADYSGAKEAEIKRNCYNRFVNDLKQLVS